MKLVKLLPVKMDSFSLSINVLIRMVSQQQSFIQDKKSLLVNGFPAIDCDMIKVLEMEQIN